MPEPKPDSIDAAQQVHPTGAVAPERPNRIASLSIVGAAAGALCTAFVGGVILKTFLPSPSTTYPLTSFAQRPELHIRQSETPPPVPPDNPRGWAVYFPNGSATLGDGEQQWLARLSSLLGECEPLKLKLTGLVSSAKFVSRSDERNLDLAHTRASVVRMFIATRVQRATLEQYTWPTYAELDTRRYIRDLRRDERIENAAEFLNRRVDIEIAQESRCPFMIQSLATPLAAKSNPDSVNSEEVKQLR